MSLVPTSVRPMAGAKFPILVSYAYARMAGSSVGFEKMAAMDDVEILLDSGAFTALNVGHEIDLKYYVAFLRKWQHRLFGYLALDVIGNPAATDRNLQIMLDAGLRPVPVHVRGDGQERMDELFGLSDWVACGGLRRPHAGHSSKSYVKQKMIWARGRNVHWLGYTSQPMVEAFKPFSVDCSNWADGHRYGKMHIYLGEGVWSRREPSRLAKPFSKREAEVLAAVGFSIEQARDERLRRIKKSVCTWSQMVPANVTAYSWIQYIRETRATVGTRVFLATSLAGSGVGEHGEVPLLQRLIRMTS